jgi:hypothetical protein
MRKIINSTNMAPLDHRGGQREDYFLLTGLILAQAGYQTRPIPDLEASERSEPNASRAAAIRPPRALSCLLHGISTRVFSREKTGWKRDSSVSENGWLEHRSCTR